MNQVNQRYYELIKEARNPAYRHTIPYSAWRERTMEILQTVFTPMYRRVFEPNWNNSTTALMRQPYIFFDFNKGIYEVYLPTNTDASGKLHYWRIIVQCYDKIDREIIEKNQPNLQTPFVRPVGIIDRETVCHLAKDTTPEYHKTLRETWKKGGRKEWFKNLLRGFRHLPRRGYFTVIIVQESPEIAVKRLLSLVYNFARKGTVGFLKKLKLQSWMFEEYLEKRHNNSLLILVKRYSVSIRRILKNLLETVDWLRMKLNDLYAEIGRQTTQKLKIKPLVDEIRQIIQVFRAKNSLRNPDVPDPPIIQRLVCVVSTP